MNDKMTWSIMLQSTSERRNQMRAPVLVAAVVTIHALAIGAVSFIQGCGTTPRQPVAVEPPPAPVMPPKQEAATPPQPVFQPAVPIEPAPSMALPTEGKTYVVQNGDSLSKIAARCGVSSRELQDLNNIKDPNKIRIGQKLLLPDYAKPQPAAKSKPKAASAPKSAPKAEAAAPVVGGSEYVVQAGDSLSKIASRTGVKVSALREANPKIKGDKILVGQKLAIPGASPAPAPAEAPAPEVLSDASMSPAPAGMTPVPMPAEPAASAVVPVESAPPQGQPMDYAIQDGDSLDSIAKMFMVSKDDLMRLNGIAEGQDVQPGQKIRIPTASP